MADCFDVCANPKCGRLIEASENAHQFHEIDCDRMLTGICRCDGWLCMSCCPDPGCTELAGRLQEARAEDRVRAVAWESAQEAPASIERDRDPVVAHPLSGFYFGGVG